MSRQNLSLLLIAIVVSILCARRNTGNPHARYVSNGFDKIDQYALDRPADDELVAGAMRGMVDVLRRRGDEHTNYFRPDAAQRYRDDLSGGFGGVGVRVGMLGEPPEPTVIGPPEPGTPAFFGGVKPNDRIAAIDGATTRGLTIDDIVSRMRGDIGQPVTLSLRRGEPSEEVIVSLKREKIKVASVLGDRRLADGSWRHRLEQDQRIALVRIDTFGDQTFDELSEAMTDLLDECVESVVLDLRGNPGGALDIAVDCCNLFLPPEAPIVETRGRDRRVRDRFVATGGPYTKLPLVVLINGGSASASEIMAACLQDNGRAVVVGERSYGKGTVQRLIEMESGQTMLKLTTASFWRPSGVDINRPPEAGDDDAWGVSPDAGYEVAVSDDDYVAYLKARSARDLIPIDAPDDASGDAPGDESAASQEHAHGEGESHDSAGEPTPFVDTVLDRAVEHLQSLLDGSAGRRLDAKPAA